jgi:hypothetical protein
MHDLPPALVSLRRHDIGRNLLFIFVWMAWFGVALFTLFSLGLYQKRAILDRPVLTPAEQRNVAGWRLRHIIPGTSRLGETILQSLAARGLRAGLHEELWLQRETTFTGQLRSQGWPVHLLPPSTAPAPGPRLEIISPAGEVVWSGAYQPGDFALGPAVIWDLRVLGEITRGQPFPSFVPAGCAAPGPAPGPAASFAWLKPRPAAAAPSSQSL